MKIESKTFRADYIGFQDFLTINRELDRIVSEFIKENNILKDDIIFISPVKVCKKIKRFKKYYYGIRTFIYCKYEKNENRNEKAYNEITKSLIKDQHILNMDWIDIILSNEYIEESNPSFIVMWALYNEEHSNYVDGIPNYLIELDAINIFNDFEGLKFYLERNMENPYGTWYWVVDVRDNKKILICSGSCDVYDKEIFESYFGVKF